MFCSCSLASKTKKKKKERAFLATQRIKWHVVVCGPVHGHYAQAGPHVAALHPPLCTPPHHQRPPLASLGLECPSFVSAACFCLCCALRQGTNVSAHGTHQHMHLRTGGRPLRALLWPAPSCFVPCFRQKMFRVRSELLCSLSREPSTVTEFLFQRKPKASSALIVCLAKLIGPNPGGVCR